MFEDLNKLKVVELKAELTKRGLDTKGVKAVLVDRLRAAIEAEGGEGSDYKEEAAPGDSDDAQEAQEVPPTPSRRGRRGAAKELSPPPREATPPPRELSPATVEETSKDEPSEEELLKEEPSKEDASKEESSKEELREEELLKEESSEEEPSKEEPSKEEASKEEPSPPLEEEPAPSLREPTPPPQEVLPPQLEPTPPPREATPPPLQPTPSLQEPTSTPQDSSSPKGDTQALSEQTSHPVEQLTTQTEAEITSDLPISEKGDVEASGEPCSNEQRELVEQRDETPVQSESVLRDVKEETVEVMEEGMDENPISSDNADDSDVKPTEKELAAQLEGTRRVRKSRFTDNEEVLQAQAEIQAQIEGEVPIKDEPMDTDIKQEPETKDVEVVSVKSESRKRRRSSSPKRRSPPRRAEDEPEIDDAAVLLSWYDSDLNLIINKADFLSATPMHQQGFGFVWAGARASFGVLKGRVCFEAKATDALDVSHLTDEVNPHVLRVGWSVLSSSMQLGEEKLSYGFGGTGKISVDCQFKNYGKSFGVGDVVTAYLDMDSNPAIISYSVNDEHFGVAYEVSHEALEGKALFPHILTKNMKFTVKFSGEPSFPLKDGYIMVGDTDIKDRVPGPRRPEKKEDCEMIMMCGLPGAGKTYWANKQLEENPEKVYNIFGTNSLIDKMKVMGLPRKRNYSGRWDVLIDKCSKCLLSLLDVACRRRRNYILDQTNVYPSAQRRKMKPFDGFKRRAVILVPTDDEFQRRVAKREAEEGKDVPDSAVLEMKANFKLPEVGDVFHEVSYVELPEEEARPLVEKYNREAREKGYAPSNPPNKRFKQERPSDRSGDRGSDRGSDRSSDRGGDRGGDRYNSREGRDGRDSHYRENREGRDGRDIRDRGSSHRPRGGGPMDRNNRWQRGGGQGGGWRDRNDGYRGRGGDSRSWRGGPGRGMGGGGYDRNRGGSFGHSRGNYGQSRGQGGGKNWGSYSSGSGSWGNWNPQQGDWGQQWQQQQQSSYGGGSGWKGYGQQQQQQQQVQQQPQSASQGYGTQGYSQQSYNYGNGNANSNSNTNAFNWNQQYYQGYNWSGQQSASASGSSAATGASTTLGTTASTGTGYDAYQQSQWNYGQGYGYNTAAGAAAAAGATSSTPHNAVAK